jgi:hypothetical protein
LFLLLFTCDPEGIQTPNLLIRSQMLYSVKLRDLLLHEAANITKFLFSGILINFNY